MRRLTMEVSGVTTRSEATTAARPLTSIVIPGGFETIVVDPPWPVKKIVRKVRPNQKAELDYVTMTLDEIKALPVQNIAADNAVLFFVDNARISRVGLRRDAGLGLQISAVPDMGQGERGLLFRVSPSH